MEPKKNSRSIQEPEEPQSTSWEDAVLNPDDLDSSTVLRILQMLDGQTPPPLAEERAGATTSANGTTRRRAEWLE